ncbi:PHP domain-containing protein [Schaalia sp. ZJ1691]|uniref:PHP domain-containing protein n=1 Tax=Schaalia sp. ZJ1691 TaxID=2709404 RepID=UPI0013EBBE8A|nr:PHP domain-containing protein [Schaalia sp. ZJ1691]
MLLIDPHTHSAVSDGTDAPDQLLHLGAKAGLTMLGLTDHDTFAGWDEAESAVASSGVSLIRGVEISCATQGITVHLLGYLPDPTHAELVSVLDRTRLSRETRARNIVERLSADFPVTWSDVLRWAPEDGPIGRPHIADALVEAGVCQDRSEVFATLLRTSSPYYVRHWAPDAVDAVALVRRAGGVPVLAHPLARTRQRFLPPESAIDDMAEAGLFGIECEHRDHSVEDRHRARDIAKRLGLRVFGSSDYHGTGKPNRLGENVTDPRVIAELEEQGTVEVIRP